jgi:hypothetical protein
VNERSVLGLEMNNSDPTVQKKDDNAPVVLLLPQFNYELRSGFSPQIGAGPRFAEDQTEYSEFIRFI